MNPDLDLALSELAERAVRRGSFVSPRTGRRYVVFESAVGGRVYRLVTRPRRGGGLRIVSVQRESGPELMASKRRPRVRRPSAPPPAAGVPAAPAAPAEPRGAHQTGPKTKGPRRDRHQKRGRVLQQRAADERAQERERQRRAALAAAAAREDPRVQALDEQIAELERQVRHAMGRNNVKRAAELQASLNSARSARDDLLHDLSGRTRESELWELFA